MASRAIDFRPIRAPAAGPLPARMIFDAAWMLCAALLLRCWWFGDPMIQVDVLFYLLVGDRLLHGALPFVDIWDRKPIGLFLIYAAIRRRGGGGIVEYQLVATGFAAATAFLIVRMARHFASEAAARAAGIVALLWLMVFDGAGGQAPIFYEPFVAGAALITLRTLLDAAPDAPALRRQGAAAMLLIGLAIQIKYTAMFEGIGLGCMLLWQAWRLHGPGRLAAVAADAAMWIAIAVAPTALVFLAYVHMGAGDAFLYANFRSIGDRAASAPAVLAHRLAVIAALAAPLLATACLGLRSKPATIEAARTRAFVVLWLAAAGIGFLAIGTLYKHYFLPVVVPLSVAAAPALGQLLVRRGRLLPSGALPLIATGSLLAFVTGVHRAEARGGVRQADALVAAIRPHMDDCLFVFDGEPILYYLTNSCLATPYAFPNHLNEHKEARAIGIDPVAELRRVLARRPSVIVSSDRPAKDGNAATWEIMRASLRAHYRPVAFVPIHHRLRIVYARIDDARSA